MRTATVNEARRLEQLANAKPCALCKVVKPLSEFSPNKRNGHGLHSYCRQCYADWRLRKEYGVGTAYKKAQIERQGGKCAIAGCGAVLDMKAAVDHCHVSGQVRAVLCNPCNLALGLLKENIRRILGLAEYARRSRQLRLVPLNASDEEKAG